jgi:hypothetical protein
MHKIKHLIVAVLGLSTAALVQARDTYNIDTNQLTIPSVVVNDTRYSNVVITVDRVISIGNTSSESEDVYNPLKNQLTISSVTVGTKVYYDVVLTVGKVLAVGVSSPINVISEVGTYSVVRRPLVTMVPATFVKGFKHVVVSGYDNTRTLFNRSAPIKIFQINIDGSTVDVTQAILGSEQTAVTNFPLIADFNNDGIDDIFMAGFDDTSENQPSVAFISRPGQSHRRVDLPDKTWSHSSAVIDINKDGYLDVVNQHGQMWINDGRGNFQFRNHSYDYNTSNGLWMHGSGVCTGDFNNTGRSQIVITDLSMDANSAPISDTVIFELNSSMIPVASHTLPMPVLDRNSTKETSHDIGCVAVDLNNDGRLDLLVFSRPDYTARNNTWTNEGTVQVLINRGNWVFEDITDRAMSSYASNTLISYTPLVTDLNGDGKPDLWMGYYDFDTGKANHAWINNGSGMFTRSLQSTIDSFGSNGPMVPIKFGNTYSFVYSKMSNNQLKIYATNSRYIFN